MASNFTIVRGDTLPLKFQRKDAEGNIIIGQPHNLTLTARKSQNRVSERLFVKRLSDGDFKQDEDGTWHVVIAPEDTEKIWQSSIFYDLEVVLDEDEEDVTTIATGTITLQAESTTPADRINDNKEENS